ncbi:MAG: hypothetical protein ACLU0O_12370 [Collinsella sp.]
MIAHVGFVLIMASFLTMTNRRGRFAFCGFPATQFGPRSIPCFVLAFLALAPRPVSSRCTAGCPRPSRGAVQRVGPHVAVA